MDTSPVYYKSLTPSNSIKVDRTCWDNALELFKKKEYSESIFAFFDYIDKTICNGKRPLELDIPHASCIVHIKLTEVGIEIIANVVNIGEETLTTPLMRSLCEINFYNLGFPHAAIRDGKVVFFANLEYTLASPSKLHDILADICRSADRFRAEYIEKFKALPAEDAIVEQYSNPTLELAWENMQKEVTQALEQYDEYLKDRKDNLRYTLLGSTITRLEYYLQPQNYLKILFDRATWDYYDHDKDFEIRTHKAKEFLMELKEMPKERFLGDLYRIKEFIPIRARTNIENIRNNWERAFNRMKYAMENKTYEMATMEMLNAIYLMYSNYNVPDTMSVPVEQALKNASGKSWKESALTLYDPVCFIMLDGHKMKSASKGGFLQGILNQFKK